MIKKKKKIKMTLDKLAVLMKTGFGNVEELVKKEIDQLAISTAKGFGSVDKRFDGVDMEIKGLKNQLGGVNKRVDDVYVNMVKYKDHETLKRRVEVLEKV